MRTVQFDGSSDCQRFFDWMLQSTNSRNDKHGLLLNMRVDRNCGQFELQKADSHMLSGIDADAKIVEYKVYPDDPNPGETEYWIERSVMVEDNS